MDRGAFVVAVALILAACTEGDPSDSGVAREREAPSATVAPDSATLDEIGGELIEMARADQEERSDFGQPDAEPWNDEDRTARLIEIVDEYGWPTPELVGDEAASAAWLIAQHSDADPGFQQRALGLLRETPDYPGKSEHVALLTDRVAANTGEPQVYGSQVGCFGDEPIPAPDLERPERADELRADAGLEPLDDYLARLDQHCAHQAQIPIDAGCRPVTGATLLLRPRPVILVGEVHGTYESPAFVEALTCVSLSYGLSVTVGLEIPLQESDSIEAFLASNGSPLARRELLDGPFWTSEVSDGRQSAAMLELLDGIRRMIGTGAPLDVVLLDSTTATDRDATMASRLLDGDASPDHAVIALTGNLHSSITRGSIFDPDHEPMGFLVERAHEDRSVVAIDVRYSGGAAWACTDGEGCGPTPLVANASTAEPLGDAIATVDLFAEPDANGFNGTYFVGDLSPAEPAVDVEPG